MPLELVNLGVSAYGRLAKVQLMPRTSTATGAPARRSSRKIYLGRKHGLQDTPIYDFDTLAPGHTLTGPAVIEQRFTTVLVLPGHAARMDSYGNILMEVPR